MGYALHCVPGNHAFDEDDAGKRFVTRVDPRYPVHQDMSVYACAEHEPLLDAHCAVWDPHDAHGLCPGTPDALA